VELPSAQTRLDSSASAASVATKLITVIAPVPLNADCVPWMVGNAGALYTENGYSKGVDFVADYIEKTKLPVLFVPVPIAAAGTVGRFDTTGNTNTSAVSVAVGAYGSLDETDGAVRINEGGVVGTDQISFDLSLDGGRSWKVGLKLGTASTYTVPYVGLVVSFAGGSLTAGETVLTWKSTAPMWDTTGLTAAKVALQAQLQQSRMWYVDGDVVNSTFAGYVLTAINAYETASERYCVAKVALKDRLPYATLSHATVQNTGVYTMSFLEVSTTGDTITRSGGSFVTDGFHNGGWVRITGSVSNNVQGVVASVAALVLTLGSLDLVTEATVSGVTITCEQALTFGDNGGSEDTITRSAGSWLEDGFRVGDSITITGSASNNVTKTITTLTATVLSVATGSFAAEVVGSVDVTIVAGQTKAAHLIANNAAFASISGKRIDLGHGRGFSLSPFLGFYMRRSVQWFDAIRMFQHDVHIASWEKDMGPLDGVSLEDLNGTLVEHDERIDSGALAAGFTCMRSWGNGPRGAFIARSVTRDTPNTVLSATENVVVASLAQTVSQMEAENVVGKNLRLKLDGTATSESLSSIGDKIDGALSRNLLADVQNEGQRASLAYVTLATDDDLSGVDATLNGVVTLVINGKIAHVNLSVRVNPGA
jgi:hypothetical protein